MSIVNEVYGTINHDTNTILEPIGVCTCGKQYTVDNGKMINYSIIQVNGQEWLYLDGAKTLPLRRTFTK